VLSGLLLNVALYALLRFKILLALNPAAIAPGPLMVILGLISCLFAAFMLYRRRDIKRMFAYSSIEHMGIIVFAFGMGGALANFAGLLHMTMHSLTKSAIFFAVGHIAQVKGTQKIADMGGLTVTNPVLGWGLVLGVVAIAGLPPLGIFMSEFLVVSSTFARAPWLAVILALGILVALGGLFPALEYDCLWPSARANRESRSLLRANVRASSTGVYGRHLHATGAGQRLRECREAIGLAPWPGSAASHITNWLRGTGPGRARS
jgi:formate hydrogenlyase subunit 3/multisubunit Na+/H+ antiporter MnhD subunit